MFEFQSTLMMVVSIALFVAKGFALVDCVSRRPSQLESLDTLPKQTWLIILAVSVVAHLVFWYPLSILNLVGTVAALVYLAQVRGSISR
ncbi:MULTISPECIES: DUF2516 family protein [Aeromicrobium]|uniref:DUF2516 family protein n=1 Tax=Aeromicrobium TaxID=2040 RepID=UPI000701BA9B|nr:MULTISPECIES: DUF2516 family protein [Aeromicrobium]KQX71717.1 hypothetical protein ASD10_17255 [Aeromicrobium sp. Root472D3]MCL8252096.1 DUF2516 family protein [Aeromicrobium fastidiosum]